MKTTPNDDFYVGYLPKAPTSLGRIAARIAAGVVLAGLIGGGLLIFGQPPFATSKFEYGEYRDYAGVIEEWPYPILVTNNASFLLVAPGKHGLSDTVKGMQGKHVQLKGSLIERIPDRMIEVIPASIIVGTSPSLATPSRTIDLGPVTLRGEIVDTKCYLGVMNPGEHKVHRDCAVRCISGGVPPAFLARDAAGDARVLLLVGNDSRALSKEVLPFVAEPLEISGVLARTGSTLTLKADPARFRRVPE
ncbi:MAG: hypothetical protein LAO55_11580 [Acidobacteriia bacterium]|nr:hypothetical protein [Terriglobia bacterium]